MPTRTDRAVLLPIALLAIAAACGGTTALGKTYTGTAPLALPDSAYACVGRELGKMGFKRRSYDAERRLITAERTSPTPRESNVLARRWYDLLDIGVTPDVSGGSDMTVKASSWIETETQRGPTTTETPLYPGAQAAADSLMVLCGGKQG